MVDPNPRPPFFSRYYCMPKHLEDAPVRSVPAWRSVSLHLPSPPPGHHRGHPSAAPSRGGSATVSRLRLAAAPKPSLALEGREGSQHQPPEREATKNSIRAGTKDGREGSEKEKAETGPLERCVRMREQNKAAIAKAPTKMRISTA